MSDFWIAFFAGLASGVVVTVLVAFTRRLLKRRSQKNRVILLKELRPFIPITIGFVLVILGALLRDSAPGLIGVGSFLVGFGAVTLFRD